MKKVILSIALLGSVYFANAQVGIGTALPSTSAELDIVSVGGNKGLLIPRVELVNTTTYQMNGTPTNNTSLLVFNKTAVTDVPEGFYYWDGVKWNRIIGKEELETIITDISGDITDIQNVINFIVPTNPGNEGNTQEEHTTIVYNPETNKMYYVTYNSTTKKYETTEVDLVELVSGAETKTFIREIKDVNGKVTGVVYFSEQTIIDWLKADKANTIDNIPNNAPGATTIDITGTVVNNIEEILGSTVNITVDGNTFTTVEEYLQYITQFSDGNVIYTNIGTVDAPNWVFQYWDEATGKYVTINLDELVAASETKTFVREIKDVNGKVTGVVYFSEQTIIDWLKADTANTIANIPNDAPGAITIDVTGTVVNNIQEILGSTVSITIDGNTFTTVEEYLQYITQFSDGNVIYTNIGTVDAPNWVFQYWDEATGKYVTINLDELVAASETKTTILRAVGGDTGLGAFDKTMAPIVDAVAKGVVYYEYNAEGGNKDYLNITEDILTSIEQNEEIKNAITNVLNNGGNVYFGDHDGDDTTDEVFYKIVNDKKVEIELPASFLVNLIKKYKDIIKQELGDHITNEGDIVFTGDIYFGKKVYLATGKTATNGDDATTTGVTFAKAIDDLAIGKVISITVLLDGNVITKSTKDVTVSTDGTKVDFNIGVGNMYTALPQSDNYTVIVEYTAKN